MALRHEDAAMTTAGKPCPYCTGPHLWIDCHRKFGEPMPTDPEDLKALADFIDHLKNRGVKFFKGDVPIRNGVANVTIEVSFDRDRDKKRETE